LPTKPPEPEPPFAQRVLDWYAFARRDLPWRRTRDPYAVWLSETMLQQTRVDTVVPYYYRFLSEFPTVSALAEAPEGKVLALWSGLGYYRRARLLHSAAKQVEHAHGGQFPRTAGALRALDGVGAYTAGAVASIAFRERAAVVDGNVARVLARLYAIDDDLKSGRGKALVWRLAAKLIAGQSGDPGDWNQALMELGATVCVPRAPRCPTCPASNHCLAKARGLTGDLPRTIPKRAPVLMNRVAVVLSSARFVLLAKRRPDVLFGGLWEPPSGNDLGGLASALAVDVGDLEPVGQVVHLLTHRRMHVSVMRGPLRHRRGRGIPGPEYDAVEAVSFDRLDERAQASLTRKVLKVANLGPRGLRSE